jgi:hypothetical protein
MNSFKEFRDLPDPIGTFERLFIAALKSLLPDLADAPWHVREREVVNLFVFGHLIPQFQTENLNISQTSIEVAVLNIPDPENENPKLSVSADIVVWPHKKATLWQTCRPLARVEWKNISCREKAPRDLERQHDEDILRLNRNQQLAYVSYAVLTDQRDKHVRLRCTRFVDGRSAQELFAAAPLGCAATCPETSITDLCRTLSELLARPQASGCPVCRKMHADIPIITS